MVAEGAVRGNFLSAVRTDRNEALSAFLAKLAAFAVQGPAGTADFILRAVAQSLLDGGSDIAHGGSELFSRLVDNGHRFVFDIAADLPPESEGSNGKADSQKGKTDECAPKFGRHIASAHRGEKVDESDSCENRAGNQTDETDDFQLFLDGIVPFPIIVLGAIVVVHAFPPKMIKFVLQKFFCKKTPNRYCRRGLFVKKWWTRKGSNLRPLPCQGSALTS